MKNNDEILHKIREYQLEKFYIVKSLKKKNSKSKMLKYI
jgi:hypothetical protein